MMLRNSRRGCQPSVPFICWKCLAINAPDTSSNTAARRALPASRKSQKNRNYATAAPASEPHRLKITRYATNESQIKSPVIESEVRSRLRDWETINQTAPVPLFTIGEKFVPGGLQNNLTRLGDGDFNIEHDQEDEDIQTDAYEVDGLVDVGDKRHFLLPGDLVELVSRGGSQIEVAIYVRQLQTQSQFYTMSGRWANRSSRVVKFYVPNFVEPKELEEILPYLPTEDVPEDDRDKLHLFSSDVPRDTGKALLQKMLKFWRDSDAIYERTATYLDNAHQMVAHDRRFSYATLEEIASKVLPSSYKTTKDGKYEKHLLYAVHRALLREDVTFSSQTKGTLRAGGQYEIHPLVEMKWIASVRGWAREYTEIQVESNEGSIPRSSVLSRWAKQARWMVHLSRNQREFTPFGTIGPCPPKLCNTGPFRSGEEKADLISPGDIIVRFLESWVGLGSFRLNSPLNATGATILRAVGMYDDVDLDQKTAWTFLQEIGAIEPWANRAALELRLPHAGRALDFEPHNLPSVPGNRSNNDRLRTLRKDWGQLPVYCIDDAGASEIDDGISIERTDSPHEYWTHIHTADPAAFLEPSSPASLSARKSVDTIYLPERISHLLDPTTIQANFSLKEDRPCLTFSAKMNLDGEILDYRITSGLIHNVLFFNPSVMKAVTLGSSYKAPIHFGHRVGPEPHLFQPSRKMLEAHEIPDSNKEELRILHTIGEARAARLKAKGGVSGGFFPNPSVSVSFNGEEWSAPTSALCRTWQGDPSIKLSIAKTDLTSKYLPPPGPDTVQSFMLIAGEVAARWCQERGIPIPYRVTPKNLGFADPFEYYSKEVLPSTDEAGNIDSDKIISYMQLLGTVQPSTTPGPHVAIGVDMMAKCTSPLRRFGDLITHWNIEATLLQEASLGQSLVGNTKEDFLLFKKAEIDAYLPWLDTKERIIKYGQRQAVKHWICQFLVRAWKFGEADIPTKLPFLVRQVNTVTGRIYGILSTFLAEAACPILKANADVKVGDLLDVEIADIDVYRRLITVKPV